MKEIISIQGVKGSYHHKVAIACYGEDVNVLECLSFPQTVEALVNDEVKVAIVAVENSIAGSILPNYMLIDKNDVHVIGEHILDIQHCLMALSGQEISDIQEVHSHPMALLQCMDFFKPYPHIKLVEDVDTAQTAQRIQENQLTGIAAIASETAAGIYDLHILATSIQTIKHNETRFLILAKGANNDSLQANKASIKLELSHAGGSLAAVLHKFHECQLNLTKIQSLPIIESPWRYAFFVDLKFDDISHFKKAEQSMPALTNQYKCLGTYKSMNS